MTAEGHLEGLYERASFDGVLYDISNPLQPVQVIVDRKAGTIYINIGSRCVARVCGTRKQLVEVDMQQ